MVRREGSTGTGARGGERRARLLVRGRPWHAAAMTEPSAWRVLQRRVLASYRVFEVSELHSQRADTGQMQSFYRIDSVDWVNVIALTSDARVIMIRQYRHGLGAITLEIPGGMVDVDETPEVAVARELFEETGYRAREVSLLGSVSPNPALFANRIHSFLATDCEQVGDIANDHDEQTQVELVEVARIDELLRAGAIDHALVMNAFAWWKLRQG